MPKRRSGTHLKDMSSVPRGQDAVHLEGQDANNVGLYHD